jgi:hypothetical protein
MGKVVPYLISYNFIFYLKILEFGNSTFRLNQFELFEFAFIYWKSYTVSLGPAQFPPFPAGPRSPRAAHTRHPTPRFW